ncbi:MAG: hypothetical protein K2L25_03320 [Alphaproteobacteria bacterium]|nr:hypothetical protein [Alphaproteobacteria bacterium]
MWKYFVFLLFALSAGNARGALNTTCAYTERYTSCNAGYYLKGSFCVVCPIGTYKDTAGTATACTACPSSGGVAGTTKSTASTSVTACYIPAGTELSDAGGKYTYTSDCFYTK